MARGRRLGKSSQAAVAQSSFLYHNHFAACGKERTGLVSICINGKQVTMIEDLEETPRTVAKRECRVCLGEHDDEIHAATLSLHSWFRAYVTRHFAKEELDQQAVA
jgi:hypothetical protein